MRVIMRRSDQVLSRIKTAVSTDIYIICCVAGNSIVYQKIEFCVYILWGLYPRHRAVAATRTVSEGRGGSSEVRLQNNSSRSQHEQYWKLKYIHR